MSLYNQVFGHNPFAAVVLATLGADPRRIGRLRDAYITPEGKFAVLTRTGGGNRSDYQEQNAYMHTLPGFIEDKDDSFDSTYAVFTYEVPEDLKEAIAKAIDNGHAYDPAVAWKKLFEDLREKRDTPEVERAKKVGEQVAKAIEENPDSGIIKV